MDHLDLIRDHGRNRRRSQGNQLIFLAPKHTVMVVFNLWAPHDTHSNTSLTYTYKWILSFSLFVLLWDWIFLKHDYLPSLAFFYLSLPGDLFSKRRLSYSQDTGADLGKWETVNCVQLTSEYLACCAEVCACENLSFVMMERTAVGFIHETSSHKSITSSWPVVLKKINALFTFLLIYLNKVKQKIK